jgi:hypothetical protein
MCEYFDFKWRPIERLANQPWLMDESGSRGVFMQSRRSIAERVIARARELGTPIDTDVEYMALVELWIEGDIDIEDMRQRYINLLARRSAERKGRQENPAFAEGSGTTAPLPKTTDVSIDGTHGAISITGDVAEGPPPDEVDPKA